MAQQILNELLANKSTIKKPYFRFKPSRIERSLERQRKDSNNSPYSLRDVRREDMLAHALEVIRTKYSESTNPELSRILSVISSPAVRDAVVAFIKIRAEYGHKDYWVPKLALQLAAPDLLGLIDILIKIQHPSDLKSLADQPLTRALNGERTRVSKLLVSQLLYEPFERLYEDLRIYIEPGKRGADIYRKTSSCHGLWHAIHNQHLYENIRLLEERHPEVFFLIRYTLFSINNNNTPSLVSFLMEKRS